MSHSRLYPPVHPSSCSRNAVTEKKICYVWRRLKSSVIFCCRSESHLLQTMVVGLRLITATHKKALKRPSKHIERRMSRTTEFSSKQLHSVFSPWQFQKTGLLYFVYLIHSHLTVLRVFLCYCFVPSTQRERYIKETSSFRNRS